MHRTTQKVLLTVENVEEVLARGGDQVRIADSIRSDDGQIRESSAGIAVQDSFGFPSEDQLRDEYGTVIEDGKTGVGREKIGDGAEGTMQNDGDHQGTGNTEVVDLHHREEHKTGG